jgi:PKD repeat protein
MKTLFVVMFVALILMPFGLTAQAEEWLWANGTGGSGNDYSQSCATDTEGNTYVVGCFRNSVSFGDIILSTLNTTGNTGFVAKMSKTGNWLWAKKLENTNQHGAYATQVSVDSDGDAYITGMYFGYIIIGSTTLYSEGVADCYVSKIDSQGNWLWASNIVTENYSAIKMTNDSFNNVYLIGQYTGQITLGSFQLFSTNYSSYFSKLDSDGNWQWAIQTGGANDDTGYSVAVDNDFNIYVTGGFSGTVTFGTTSLSSVSHNSTYIAKLNSSLEWQWAKKITGSASTNPVSHNTGYDIEIDEQNNVYVAGQFINNATFGSVTLSSSGDYDIYLTKLDSNGEWLWARKAGGSSTDSCDNITIDSDANVYLLGYFLGNITFGSNVVTSSGAADMVIAKIDSAGNWLIAHNIGGIGSDVATGISIDASDNVYITGYYYANLTIGDFLISHIGVDGDILVAKYGYPQLEAAFSANVLTGIQPLQVQFTDESQQGPGPITSWFWDFGDGETSTLQNPNHTYLDAGIFDVSLTVTNTSDSTSTLILEDYITVIDDEASVLLLTDDHISFGSVYIEEISEVHTVTFQNNGSQPLTFSDDYLLSNSTNFEYQIPGWNYIWQPGETGNIYIRFTPQEIGAITDTLVIVNNSANQPLLKIKLSGTGLYVPLEIPTNVAITMNGDDAIITWDPVTENLHGQPITPDYYFVWFNGLSSEEAPYYFLAPVTGTTYTHVGVALGAQYMFYRVTAVKFYRDDLSSSELDSYLNSNIIPGMTEADVRAFLKQIE